MYMRLCWVEGLGSPGTHFFTLAILAKVYKLRIYYMYYASLLDRGGEQVSTKTYAMQPVIKNDLGRPCTSRSILCWVAWTGRISMHNVVVTT